MKIFKENTKFSEILKMFGESLRNLKTFWMRVKELIFVRFVNSGYSCGLHMFHRWVTLPNIILSTSPNLTICDPITTTPPLWYEKYASLQIYPFYLPVCDGSPCRIRWKGKRILITTWCPRAEIIWKLFSNFLHRCMKCNQIC